MFFLIIIYVFSYDINKVEYNLKPIKPIISDIVDSTITQTFQNVLLIRKYEKTLL